MELPPRFSSMFRFAQSETLQQRSGRPPGHVPKAQDPVLRQVRTGGAMQQLVDHVLKLQEFLVLRPGVGEKIGDKKNKVVLLLMND